MDRSLLKYLQEDYRQKILIITGPRQCGKTTVSKMISPHNDYLNYDEASHRLQIHQKAWDRKCDYVIFDELHKLKNWKSWLKGTFDTEGVPPGLVVTGSAKLDTYKKMGDSLAGRFFSYRLHPFDIRELCQHNPSLDISSTIDRLLAVGGFPEPYLQETSRFYNKWKKSHLDIILRQDLIDMESVKNILSLETLIELLKHRVGSPISYKSLSEDLQCSDKTIKRWLSILENMYVIFKLRPFHKNIARSLLKAPKYYFYDNAQVKGDDGVKLENLVACSLLKECHFRQDGLGEDYELSYLIKRGGKEIDFLIQVGGHPRIMVEVKQSDDRPSANFKLFQKDLPAVNKIQLVRYLKKEKTYPDGTEVREVGNWLARW